MVGVSSVACAKYRITKRTRPAWHIDALWLAPASLATLLKNSFKRSYTLRTEAAVSFSHMSPHASSWCTSSGKGGASVGFAKFVVSRLNAAGALHHEVAAGSRSANMPSRLKNDESKCSLNGWRPSDLDMFKLRCRRCLNSSKLVALNASPLDSNAWFIFVGKEFASTTSSLGPMLIRAGIVGKSSPSHRDAADAPWCVKHASMNCEESSTKRASAAAKRSTLCLWRAIADDWYVASDFALYASFSDCGKDVYPSELSFHNAGFDAEAVWPYE